MTTREMNCETLRDRVVRAMDHRQAPEQVQGVSEHVPAVASQVAPSPASVTSAGSSESRWPGASIVSGRTWHVSQP